MSNPITYTIPTLPAVNANPRTLAELIDELTELSHAAGEIAAQLARERTRMRVSAVRASLMRADEQVKRVRAEIDARIGGDK